MKKLLIVALTLFTVTVFAQPGRQAKMKNAIDNRMAKEGKGSPETMAEIKSKQLTLQLDLSETQQSQVQSALLEHFTTEKKKKDAFRKSTEKPTQEERVAMKSEALDAQIELKRKMKNILNDDQYEKYSQMMERRIKNGKRKGKKK